MFTHYSYHVSGRNLISSKVGWELEGLVGPLSYQYSPWLHHCVNAFKDGQKHIHTYTHTHTYAYHLILNNHAGYFFMDQAMKIF